MVCCSWEIHIYELGNRNYNAGYIQKICLEEDGDVSFLQKELHKILSAIFICKYDK